MAQRGDIARYSIWQGMGHRWIASESMPPTFLELISVVPVFEELG